MTNDATPDYIELGDGFAHVTLKGAVEIDGTKVGKLTMREPTVGDQLAMDAHKGTDAQKEIQLFANLCEQTPATIQALKLADYRRLQEAFRLFLA